MWRCLTLVCLLVTLAIAAVWVDSRRHRIWMEYAWGDRGVVFVSDGQLIWLLVERNPRIPKYIAEQGGGFHGARTLGGSDNLWSGLPRSFLGQTGFQASYHVGPGALIWQREFSAPYWFPTFTFGLPPAIWFYIRIKRWQRKQKRIAAGLCGQCGYDLRASPERCPECGAACPVASQSLPVNP